MRRAIKLMITVMCIAVLPLTSSAQDSPLVSLPTVTPAVVTASSTIQLKIAVSISHPDGTAVIPESVNLIQVDADGKAMYPPVARLNDDGVDGDDSADDMIFGGLLTIPAGSPGLIRLQVSAAFYGMLRRVLSPVAMVEVFPSGVPLRIQPSGLSGINVACVQSPSGDQFISNEVLMFFEPGTDYGIILQAASSVGGTVMGLQSFPRFNIWQIQLSCSGPSCVQAAVDSLRSDPSTLRAEPNFCTEFLGVRPNDPLFTGAGGQYGPQIIQADKAWAITKGDLVTNRNSIPILAIVDSGIDDTHPDLTGRVQRGTNFTNVTPFMDDCGHGTEVAGVAGATGNNGVDIAGISWYAKLLDLKVSRLSLVNPLMEQLRCQGTVLSEAAAFREAVDSGATVINYSQGSNSRSKAEAQAVEYINKADRLLVSAAGNENTTVKLYPAGYALKECFGVLFRDCYNTTNVSVGATDQNDLRWDDGPGNGSNFGDWVLFYAPGVNIVTTRARVLGGTTTVTGTSYAVPHVAGTASLAKASNPRRSMFSVYLRLGDDRIGNDPNGNVMARINAFKTVLAASAENCGTCPRAPTVNLSPRDASVNMGVAGSPRDATQAISVHGVSIPLDAATSYDVTFDGNLSSWDSCGQAQGFRDCFSVSVSAQPFWMIARDNRDPTLNPNLSVGFVWGGMIRGSPVLQTLNIIQSSPNMRSLGASNFLNIALDTAAGVNPDNTFPSWGTIRVLDITPR